jgi:hypothetical protein
MPSRLICIHVSGSSCRAHSYWTQQHQSQRHCQRLSNQQVALSSVVQQQQQQAWQLQSVAAGSGRSVMLWGPLQALLLLAVMR